MESLKPLPHNDVAASSNGSSSRLRILLLAPECNPEGVTNPSIGYYQAEALARIHHVTLVLYASNEDAVRRGGAAFDAIEPVRLRWLDALYDWGIKRVFKFDYGRQSLTAASYPRHVFFELRAWRQLRRQIRSGDFDVVLRILPYNRVFPSPFSWLLRHGPIPFVIGPVSGGLPWLKGFQQLDQQREAPGYWIWNLRSLARYVPFARSTYGKAAAIIAGSSHTYAELAPHRDRLFFMPTEIGVNPSLFEESGGSRSSRDLKPEFIFVGRLIPLKACDIALKGAAQLLRAGAAHFTIVGDGPQRESLQQLTKDLRNRKCRVLYGVAAPCRNVEGSPECRRAGISVTARNWRRRCLRSAQCGCGACGGRFRWAR